MLVELRRGLVVKIWRSESLITIRIALVATSIVVWRIIHSHGIVVHGHGVIIRMRVLVYLVR